jgi:eukaryotic-like serine/threonine-protein kinase
MATVEEPARAAGGSEALQTALADQFTLERVVGRGGMGVVYLARETRLDRFVAIKVLPRELAEQRAVRERFLREARIAAMLSHPNVIPVYRVEEVDDLIYVVMAYVDGPTLGSRVRREGALPQQEVARIVREVAWALAYAHARGVVHCDVTPDNILLDRATGRVIVTDFGIAQAGGEMEANVSRPVVGTAHFMSPEQIAGKPLDGRSDIYSLGVVAWYALAGRLPFDGPASEVLRKQAYEEPQPLTAVNPRIPPLLAQTIHRALAKSADERFQSAESFADAIALSIAPEVVASVPLQIWLAGGDDVRYVFAGLLGFTGLAVSHHGPWHETLAYLTAAILGYLLLEILDVRRLMAAGYQLHHLRAALRMHVEQKTRPDRYASDRASASKFQRERRTNLRVLGVVTVALAIIGMLAVTIIHRRISSHAVGVAILGIGLLALGRRRMFEPDRVAIARAKLWCGRLGRWLGAIAGWRVPTGRSVAVDAALLLPPLAGEPVGRGNDAAASTITARHTARADSAAIG